MAARQDATHREDTSVQGLVAADRWKVQTGPMPMRGGAACRGSSIMKMPAPPSPVMTPSHERSPALVVGNRLRTVAGCFKTG